MRLLSRKNGVLTFTQTRVAEVPYAILSHTWGTAEDEISFEDIRDGNLDKPGFDKVDFCLSQAARDGHDYVWIDSCCIDRRSTAELGKAINEMYDNYAQAAVCYVYLTDVLTIENVSSSRWFTRGWTLQELIAPSRMKFFSKQRQHLGDRLSLRKRIEDACSIDVTDDIDSVSIVQRYEWALSRDTTEPEDRAYCLAGLLQVSILPNYGEGETRARERLFNQVADEHGKPTEQQLRTAYVQHAAGIIEPPRTKRWNYKRVLEALSYNSMTARQDNIANPFPGTCSWLLDHRDYQRWLTAPKGLLWIKGKPGAGKSVLMKFAEKNVPRMGPRLSFYFNARGSKIDKCTEGMYRALVYQLLHQAAHLFTLFSGERPENAETIVRDPKKALHTAIEGCSDPLQLFIDALDECSVTEVQEMIYFFQDLAMGCDRLHICFASRYYPALTIKDSIELHLDNELHDNDLEKYVIGRLNVPQTDHGRRLRGKVISKARGIFFWAILVVELLNKQLSCGDILQVEETVNTLPSELKELLQSIANQEPDDGRFRISLQWVLFSARSLSPKELYMGILTLLYIAGRRQTIPRWDDQLNDMSQVERFITNSSRGLVDVVRPTYETQFIHQSVKDYLVDGGMQSMRASDDFVSLAHDELKLACEAYLKHELGCLQARDYDEGAHRAASARASLFPLSFYAWDYLLYHAERAASLDQRSFLHRMRAFPSHPPRIATSKRETNQRFGAYPIYNRSYDAYCNWNWLQLVSYFKAPSLIPLAQHNVGERKAFDPTPPLAIAVALNHLDTARALLDNGADINIKINGQSLLHVCIVDQSMLRMLLDRGANTELRNFHEETPIFTASWLGAKKSVTLLSNYRAKLDALGGLYQRSALIEACSRGLYDTASELLALGAKVDIIDSMGNTALIATAEAFVATGVQNGVLGLAGRKAAALFIKQLGLHNLTISELEGARQILDTSDEKGIKYHDTDRLAILAILDGKIASMANPGHL